MAEGSAAGKRLLMEGVLSGHEEKNSEDDYSVHEREVGPMVMHRSWREAAELRGRREKGEGGGEGGSRKTQRELSDGSSTNEHSRPLVISMPSAPANAAAAAVVSCSSVP
jgi:hypothetical protein